MFSIQFDDIDTWETYQLVPTSRPDVNPPAAKTNYIDVYSPDGALDLSTALTGFMLFDNRKGSWEFYTRNRAMPWEVLYHRLLNELHGRSFRVKLSQQPDFYYIGRIFVKDPKSPKTHTNPTLEYFLEPYKYELTTSLEPWLWDPFNFETGIIRDYSGLTVDGTLALFIPASSRPYIPTITASAAMTVETGGETYQLAAGENRITEILIDKDTTLTFSGSGTVSVEYQGAWL